MTVTATLFIVALVAILAGLAIVYLSRQAGTTLAPVFWWAGILVAVLGLILLVVPVLIYIQRQLVSAFGIG